MTAQRPVRVHVRDWMRADPLVVQAKDSIERARGLCEEHRINQLPVVSGRSLVGIVTDRDLRDAFPSVAEEARDPERAHDETASVTVESVMSPRVLTVDADDSVARAAVVMQEERIGALPVVSAGRLVGIVTRHDLLRALVALVKHVTPD
jgi:acetoin utilization protein AcuB